jgi:GNAT superfamily N-acetyltransferase
MTAPTFRTATAADLPTVQDLLLCLESDVAVRLPPERALAVFARIAANPGYLLWLVELDGIAVGTYSLIIIDNLAHAGAPGALVENVAVAAAHRGHGLGEAMMRHAMAECAARGCYKLALSSNQRRVDAHRFYRRLGFGQHGISFLVAPPTATAP